MNQEVLCLYHFFLPQEHSQNQDQEFAQYMYQAVFVYLWIINLVLINKRKMYLKLCYKVEKLILYIYFNWKTVFFILMKT